jgi:precorrin-6Y C5,15-methyltransferase (decarboxylating)
VLNGELYYNERSDNQQHEEENGMNQNGAAFTNEQMLEWLGYFTKLREIGPEKVKIVNDFGKRRNVVPSIEAHKRVLIFTDEHHEDLFYECWEAGLGEYDTWYASEDASPDSVKSCKIKDLSDRKITGPMVFYVENERTRESYRFGMKNENFSRGPIRYVGNEIRAVIMSLLNVDVYDTICIVTGESIAIEAAIVASEGTIIAVESDEGSKESMEDNVQKFGVHNVEIISELSEETLKDLPAPRLGFVVSSNQLEHDIEQLLKKNPKMQIIIYTLELDVLSGIKSIFERHNIRNMEVIQISVSKTDKNSVFVAQPSPWLITGEAF